MTLLMEVVPITLAVLAALLTIKLISPILDEPLSEGRFQSIDGIRGYLGFSVFLHHSCIWYFYLKNKAWAVPPSYIYTNLGQGGVAIFFMITSFLFFTKILDHKSKPIDWIYLYSSRILRLLPLYLTATFIMFSIVAIKTNFELAEPVSSIAKEALNWVRFSQSDINKLQNTWIIFAGVTWTLPYELAFYSFLPIIYITFKHYNKYWHLPTIACIYVGFQYFRMLDLNSLFLKVFLSGIIAALISRIELAQKLSNTKFTSLIVIILLITATTNFASSYESTPLLMLTVAFTLIASGNSIFGLLTSQLSRKLGEITYSIYLLHGIILYFLFSVLIGEDKSSRFSPVEFWIIVVLITPVVISISVFSFRFIERPSIRKSSSLANLIKTATSTYSNKNLQNKV